MNPLSNAAKAGLLVDFDALFDTRLAILDELDPLLAAHALKNGYLEREEDSFEHCNFEMFRELYLARDNQTLARSIMTPVKDVVIDFARDSIKALRSAKTQHNPNIYINVYPYKISADAAGEVLKPFYKAVEGKANIHLVNMKPEDLTVEMCKKHLSYVIKYDYMPWLIFLGQEGVIQKNPLNEITLVAPRLYPSGKPKDAEDLVSRNKMQPYQCTEVFFAPYIKLELYPTPLFCAAIDQMFIDSYIEEIGKVQQSLD